MYVWVGCDINSQFFQFRERVKELVAELNVSEATLRFPQHISLKITFETDDALAKHCMRDMIDYLSGLKPFALRTEQLELLDGIVWIRTEQCDELKQIHAELDQIAISYAIKQHPLDKEYIFHTTVAMDEDGGKLKALLERLQGVEYPKELKINTFLVGHSYDNQEFKIDRRIKVKK